ncbi:MAG: GNAT family N-acetyltransferase [Luteimonas sp.]
MQTFDTQRLHLRPMDDSDGAFYCRLYTDPELMRHIATPMSPERAHRSFHAAMKQQGDARMIWIITEHGGEAACGILGVFPQDDAAEVGVMLVPHAQARGFAAEVIASIAGTLFRTGRIRRLWTRHARHNAPAGALMRNLGFTPCAGEGLPSTMPADEMRWEFQRGAWAGAGGPEAVATAESCG